MPLTIFQKISNIIVIIITVIYNINCSNLKNISQNNEITQGNCLNIYDIQKIHVGMTKQEISHNIGLPTLQNLFKPNTWYYIYYHRNRQGIIQQQTFILEFDKNNTLITLKSKYII